jgi:hypothetical protein
MSVRDATSGKEKKKTSSSKGTEDYRCNSVISWSANSSQLQLQLHLYTISSNGSIVFDFSKQLNDQPFAPSKAVDFALVVSTFKPPGINRFGILMPLKVRCVSQADLPRFFLESFCSSPNTWSGRTRLYLPYLEISMKLPSLNIYISRLRLRYLDDLMRL